MFRAVVQVTHYSRQGWDSYKDSYVENIEAKSVKRCKELAAEFIKRTEAHKGTGDFGIVLSSYTAELKSVEKYTILEEC